MTSGGAQIPTPSPRTPDQRTPDQRAEALIADAMAIDVVEQQAVVCRRAEALALGRRFHHQDRDEIVRLRSAADAAERHLAVLRHRQAAWRRDRTFERDLVERVLLMARIADFRETGARPGGTTLTAVIGYLRTHHPPVD